MSIAELPEVKQWSAEDLIDLPEDGIERELIRGELREWPMSYRNPVNSVTESRITIQLGLWMDRQPAPRGMIVGGEAAFRIHRDPVTFVGIDVAYVSAEMAAAHDWEQKFFDGPPVLAVEIYSPSDRHRDVIEKIKLYLEAGTVVWMVEPYFRTVMVYRAGEAPQSWNDRQEIDGQPYLPGFQVPVIRFFRP